MSHLFNTDGSGRLELGWSARFAVNNVLEWGFFRGVMNGDATRFAYLTPAGSNNGERLQIGGAELNPLNLGLAPTITGASTSPAYITTNGTSPNASIAAWGCRELPVYWRLLQVNRPSITIALRPAR